MSQAFFSLTNQKLPDSKKDKEWHVGILKNYLSYTLRRVTSERREQQLKCWKYYLCIIDEEREAANRPITAPYQTSLGMEWIPYPLAESKLEQMIGDFITRGIKTKMQVINKEARSKKLDQMFSMISEEILRETNKELQPALGFVPTTENQDIDLPEDLEEFFETDFKTQSEQVSDIILKQVLYGKKMIDKVRELYLHYLVQDECIAWVEETDKQPSFRNCSIFETEMDYDPEKEVQDEPQWIFFNRTMGYNEIINNHDLTDEEENILKSYVSNNRYLADEDLLSNTDGFDSPYKREHWFEGQKENMRIRCVEGHWISKKKISVKVSINQKNGEEIYKRISDDYKAKKSDNIKSIWVDEKRYCIMVGPDLVLDYGVNEERWSRIDSPKKDILEAVAIRRNNSIGSNQVRSAVAKLMQLQDFASECLFELRLAMRRNNGRVLVYDAAQVPKQFLKSGGYNSAINRVMHHAKKDQFLLINSMDKQARYAFNQFTSLDMSTRGLMQDLFNMLALIEDLASKFIGLPPQSEGQTNQYETAGGTERAVTQGNIRQQIFVKPFESFLKHLFDKVLIKGKHCYEENEVVQFLFGDLKSSFFKVYPDYFQEDVGSFIGDGYNEQKKKQIIDAAAQQAFGNAQTPEMILYMIQSLNAEYASESEAILKRGLKAMTKLADENRQAEAENAKMQAEATDRATESNENLTREGHKKDIIVAQIYADNKTMTDAMKNETQRKIKLDDIEKDLILNEQKNNSGTSK